jgi:hypothetical protein
MEMLDDGLTGNIKVQISLVNATSNYSCEQVIQLSYDDVKDFTH